MQDHPPLLAIASPQDLRVLYLAQYAPTAPGFELVQSDNDGGYPAYHHNVYNYLSGLGCQVWSSRSPSSLLASARHVDYVYSLLNRMPIANSEIFVSSLCEYLRLPYLGASPAVRAIAEDKFLFKLQAQACGIKTPLGAVYKAPDVEPEPPFPPPYFIKDRTGAASEGISTVNLASSWSNATLIIEALHAEGKDALVEEFCSGIDITAPVIGGKPFHILGFVHAKSDEPEKILTHDLKLDDHLGYEIISLPGTVQATIATDVEKLWQVLGPVDYFRVDYRYDPSSQLLNLLEMNICCHLEESSSIGLAASSQGIPFSSLFDHIIAYSLERKRLGAKKSKWVL